MRLSALLCALLLAVMASFSGLALAATIEERDFEERSFGSWHPRGKQASPGRMQGVAAARKAAAGASQARGLRGVEVRDLWGEQAMPIMIPFRQRACTQRSA